ncbi:MAG TPA: SDR family NAD(P)-dependent oxidoreductase [Deltaproteobacteria bacterium]|nr:SDR family NAD(P)-dependent oxidoreductase [Deltaproteobacteria bacterium]
MGMKNLQGRTAVVTGAASGIGRELARALAREGCIVLLADINEAGLEQTLELVKQAGGSGETFVCDVSRLDDVTKMADHCCKTWGRVDLLVNNAGVASTGFVGDIPIQDWEWIVSINFWGVVYGCHAFVPGMKRQGSGHIVNVASAAGILSSPEMAPYNATKAAVISISETLKGELAPYNIGVTVLCPTYVKTDLLERMRFTDEFQRKCSTTGMANARWSPDRIARLVVDAVKKNRMYLVPQPAAKIFWYSKRISPCAFHGFFAFIMRMGWGRKVMYWLCRLGF